MTPKQQAAAKYLAQALNDFSSTMPPSVRGPFSREADGALRELTEPTDVHPAKDNKPEAKI